MSTADVVGLATKCGTLMASDVHKIPLFTPDFIKRLINCIYPFLFKVYLLPYMSWFDYSVLKQLVHVSKNDEALKMLDDFVDSLNYSIPITSYQIPKFSQLVIPLDESQYTLLVTKHITNINTLVLRDVKDIEVSLIKRLEITEHAIQLTAIHHESCCLYWLIPNHLRALVEKNLNIVQLELWNKGIITRLLPVNFYEKVLQQNVNDDFFHIKLEDPLEV